MADKNQHVIPHHAREGNAELIRGVALFDTPEPGTGNRLLSCALPGMGALVVYPGCEVVIDAGEVIISGLESEQLQLQARLKVAAIELKGDEVRFHPPASDARLRAVARVCDQFDIDIKDPFALMKLTVALIDKHYPETLLPAGRLLSSDERAMSIAWVVDQERQDDEISPDAIKRARPKLLSYGLIEDSIKDRTLARLFREGQALLRQRGMDPWRKRAQGRPRKKIVHRNSVDGT